MPKPLSPLLTGAIYAVLGVIWVLSTDVWIHQFYRSTIFDTFSLVQLFKDTLLVIFTGLLLYVILKKNRDRLLSYKQANEALDKHEQLLKTIINSTQSMVWAINPALQVIAMNESFRKNAASLPGLSEPDAYWKGCYEKSLRGKKQLMDFTGQKDAGTWHHVQISFDPIFHNGKITGVACVAWDMTEKKRQELALKKAVERYEILTQATNDVIYDLDLITNKVLFNYNGQDLFGQKGLENDLTRWSERVHPEDVGPIIESFERAMQEKLHHWQGEYRLRNPRGEYRHVNSRGYILYDVNKMPVRMIGAIQDIEDRKVKDEEIRKLSLIASMTHNPVIITDAQANIEWVNKSFEDLSGYVLEDIKGLSPRSFLHGEGTDPEIADEIGEKLAASQSCIVEALNYTITGEPYWVLMDITPVTNTSGELERHIIIQTNITEQKKIAQQLEQKNKLLLDMAFISSHRLRASVASLLGILLQLDKQDLSRPENATLIQHIDKLVKDMDITLHEMADKCNHIYENGLPPQG